MSSRVRFRPRSTSPGRIPLRYRVHGPFELPEGKEINPTLVKLQSYSLSTPAIAAAVLRLIRDRRWDPGGRHLDIGSGGGELIQLIREEFGFQSWACDYTDALMQLPDQKVEIVDLNKQPLPYESNSFDLVTFVEVIEHIECCRRIIRESYRVLKPGGLLVVTTPNILNLKSRVRYLCFGFYSLFGPLPVHERTIFNSDGHINPISFFYLAHALLDAEFTDLRLGVDKLQRSSIGLLLPMWIPIKLVAFFIHRRERLRYRTIDEINAPLVKAMNSKEILLGRTVVLAASKPKGG